MRTEEKTLTRREAYEYVMNTQSAIAIVEHLRCELSQYFTVEYDEDTSYNIIMQDSLLTIKRFEQHGYIVELQGVVIEEARLHIGQEETRCNDFALQMFLQRLDGYVRIGSELWNAKKRGDIKWS